MITFLSATFVFASRKCYFVYRKHPARLTTPHKKEQLAEAARTAQLSRRLRLLHHCDWKRYPETLTGRRAAFLLGMHPRSLERAVRERGLLPYTMPHRQLRVYQKADVRKLLLRWLAEADLRGLR